MGPSSYHGREPSRLRRDRREQNQPRKRESSWREDERSCDVEFHEAAPGRRVICPRLEMLLVFPRFCASCGLRCFRAIGFILLAAPVYADSYRRQPALDVIHYEIAIELADESDAISGTTRVHVRMRQDGITAMWLDLEAMKVTGLKVGGADAFLHPARWPARF